MIYSESGRVSERISDREFQLSTWLASIFPDQALRLSPVAGDASFRRYFRVHMKENSLIAMDAPPEKESCAAFVNIAKAFEKSSVRFPVVRFSDQTQGFLLLTDFGDQQLWSLLNEKSVDALYGKAIQTLLSMQQFMHLPTLPSFDDTLYWKEFDIFDQWYLGANLQKKLSDQDQKNLRAQYQLLIDSAKLQPQVFVHRDYHSRNLMLCADGELGILDFQDAVMGPITYDLVSLLRDCYIDWPRERVEAWACDFYKKAHIAPDFDTFLKWFDWMGLQRHLKCLGIFSRLNFRDHKPGYLKDIPRVLAYARDICVRYPALSLLRELLS